MDGEKNVKKKRKLKPLDIVLYIALAVFAGVFVFCAVKIGIYIYENVTANELYNNGANKKIGELVEETEETRYPVWSRGAETEPTEPDDPADTTPSIPDDTTVTERPEDTTVPDDTTTPEETTVTDPPETEPEKPEYSPEFLKLRDEILAVQAQYPDVIGYITIPSVSLNLPVVQRKTDIQNKYYLTHDYKGSYTGLGAIFVDYRSSADLTSRNTVIYGHNMRAGTMFGALRQIINYPDIFEDTEIILSTTEGVFTYKLFSAFHTTSEHNYTKMNFTSDDDFLNFCIDEQANSKYPCDEYFTASDRIITLSTCDNLTHDGRYAFHAVLVSIEK